MAKKIGRIGSAVAGISVFCFAVCMLIPFPFGSYLVCMFLAIGYVMMAAAFQSECPPDRKAAGNLGLIFAGIYAVLILLVYYAQTTTVRLEPMAETAMRLLNYEKFGLFFNYDLLGYGMMALSTFFSGLTLPAPSRREHALKLLLLIHGLFFFSCFFVPMCGVFSAEAEGIAWIGTLLLEVWCAYFLPVTILSYLHFGVKE